jgi:hypothetical protein
MIKYVALETIDIWIKDEIYDVDFIFTEDDMDKWEFSFNILNIYYNGKLIGDYNEKILKERFKLLAEVRQERINEILND